MSDSAGGFNAALHAQINLNGKKDGGGGDGANEKDIVQGLIFDGGSEKAASTASKMASAILPAAVVPNLTQAGSIGIFQMFEKAESWIDQKINMFASSFSSGGGFWARLAAVFLKNGNITDQTAGAGGEGGGGGGGGNHGGGDGGGGEAMMAGGGAGHGGGGDFHGHSGHGEAMMVASSYGDKMTVVPMSEERLGQITPSSGTDLGSAVSRNSGIEMG